MSIFALKMLAVLLMLFDHTAAFLEPFLPPQAYLPMRWLGRPALPLFLFCLAEGLAHTKSRPRYLLRLYAFSALTSALDQAAVSLCPSAHGFDGHNIFATLFLAAYIVCTAELWQRDKRRGGLMLLGFLALQLGFVLLPRAFPPLREVGAARLAGLLPSMGNVEFGAAYVLLGVLLYYLRGRRGLLCLFFLLFGSWQLAEDIEYFGLPMQGLVVAALPLLLAYNGQKGRGCKWFFYIFYPTHLCALFYIANYISG